MKIYINDSTNSAKLLYYQSLVLMFLPCESFSQNDISDNALYVDALVEKDKYVCNVSFVCGDNKATVSGEEIICFDKQNQMKNLIGRLILKAGFDLFGVIPPWGISTGVKPLKLARGYLENFGTDEAYKILCNDYSISPKKASMAINASINESKIVSRFKNNPFSLYISIPFCPTKCNYCSFVSCTTPRLLSLIPQYLEKLKSDIVIASKTAKDAGLNLESVYFGGGTPAILDAFQINELLECVYKSFDIGDKCEVTFEAGRPECITKDKLLVLKRFGVNRISVNTQSTNDNVLKAIGRNHTYSDFLKAFELARSVGFECINTDLIAGLEGDDYKSFCKSVTDVAALEPENITVHAFTLKKSSNFRVSGTKNFSVNCKQAQDMTDFAFDYLYNKEYSPYYVYRQKNTVGNLENVGYSKRGFESVYNVVMMGEYHTVLGCGAGSVTKVVADSGKTVNRIYAPKYPYEFIDDIKYQGFDCNKVLELLKKGD